MMKPAPIDEEGDAVCSFGCGGYCVVMDNRWCWPIARWIEVKYCPICGRPLGFDEDGNPVVGPSYAELERAALSIARVREQLAHGALVRGPEHRQLHPDYLDQAAGHRLSVALDEAQEAPDARVD